MSFKKNTAVTGFIFGLVSSTDGSDITTGTPVGYYTLDGGVQTAIGDVTPVHEGNGAWSFDILAAEMNGDIVGLTFTHASAITVHFTIKTDTKIVSELNDVLGPTVAAFEARTIDSVAADNLEATYDGTGYADDKAPASQEQVGSLGGGTSSGFNYAPDTDNTAGAIIDGVVFVGTQTGTFSNVAANPATFHQIDAVGNAIDLVYRISTGAVNQAVAVNASLYLNSNNDVLDIQIYDHIGATWDTQFSVNGKNGSSIDEYQMRPFSKHTGAVGTAEAGNIYIRFVTTGQTSPSLFISLSIAEAVASGSIAGYEAGAVYCDEASGTSTGTVQGTDGIFANQCDDFDNAQTIADNLGASTIIIRNGNSVTLTAALESYSLFGRGGALALGGQNIGSSIIREFGSITGIGGTSLNPCFFEQNVFGTCSIPPCVAQGCGFGGTTTMASAGDFSFATSYSTVAGDGAPVFTKTAGQAITAEWRDWKGGITLSNIESGDVMTIGGTELGTITLNGANGLVEIRGIYKALIDNRTGSPVLNSSGAISASDVAGILEDTAEMGTAGAGLTDLGGMSTAMKAEVNAEADTALGDAGIAAIKAKTDDLTFTVANQVDTNAKSMNNAAITGAGTEGDPWT